MFQQLMNDEMGVIISAELVLVLTVGVLGVIVGLSEVAAAVTLELNDVSNAVGALNQSFSFTGFVSQGTTLKSIVIGTTFVDTFDDCDTNTSCDIVGGVAANAIGAGG